MSDAARPPERWEKLAERSLTPTRIFDLRTITYRHPTRKTERDFYVIHAPDWVNVIALTPDHQLVLVNQFRYGIDDFSLEIPGGVMDQGETPEQTAARELREETGFIGSSVRVLGHVHPNPAILNNRCHLVFIDQAVRTAEQDWDTDEEIEVRCAPVEQVFAWARDGRITHSLVLNALLLFAPIWDKLKNR